MGVKTMNSAQAAFVIGVSLYQLRNWTDEMKGIRTDGQNAIFLAREVRRKSRELDCIDRVTPKTALAWLGVIPDGQGYGKWPKWLRRQTEFDAQEIRMHCRYWCPSRMVERIKITAQTLWVWRAEGVGPAWFKDEAGRIWYLQGEMVQPAYEWMSQSLLPARAFMNNNK